MDSLRGSFFDGLEGISLWLFSLHSLEGARRLCLWMSPRVSLLSFLLIGYVCGK